MSIENETQFVPEDIPGGMYVHMLRAGKNRLSGGIIPGKNGLLVLLQGPGIGIPGSGYQFFKTAEFCLPAEALSRQTG